jgi:hypothetical protein
LQAFYGFYPLFGCWKLWEKKRKQVGSWDLSNLDKNVLLLFSNFFFSVIQFRLQCIITLLCFGCPEIVAMLVIVVRDMGRGAGEDA